MPRLHGPGYLCVNFAIVGRVEKKNEKVYLVVYCTINSTRPSKCHVPSVVPVDVNLCRGIQLDLRDELPPDWSESRPLDDVPNGESLLSGSQASPV